MKEPFLTPELLGVICYLALIIVLAGCFGGVGGGRGKPRRSKSHPWLLYYRDGSVELDMSHPEWQETFRKQLKEIDELEQFERQRRASR